MSELCLGIVSQLWPIWSVLVQAGRVDAHDRVDVFSRRAIDELSNRHFELFRRSVVGNVGHANDDFRNVTSRELGNDARTNRLHVVFRRGPTVRRLDEQDDSFVAVDLLRYANRLEQRIDRLIDLCRSNADLSPS